MLLLAVQDREGRHGSSPPPTPQTEQVFHDYLKSLQDDHNEVA